MNVVSTILAGAIQLVVFVALLAAVAKIFQIGTDLGEIKDLLRDMKRNSDAERYANPPLGAPATAPPHYEASYEASVAGLAENLDYPENPVTQPEPPR